MNKNPYLTPLEQYYIDNPKKFTKSNKKKKRQRSVKQKPKTPKEKYKEFLLFCKNFLFSLTQLFKRVNIHKILFK